MDDCDDNSHSGVVNCSEILILVKLREATLTESRDSRCFIAAVILLGCVYHSVMVSFIPSPPCFPKNRTSLN